MFIKVENINNLENLINKLIRKGFSKSKYSCNEKDKNLIKGVAVYKPNKQYILLNDEMMSTDVHKSWILHREEYTNEKDFINKLLY